MATLRTPASPRLARGHATEPRRRVSRARLAGDVSGPLRWRDGGPLSARDSAAPLIPADRDDSHSDGIAGALAPRQTVSPEPLRATERFYHPELDGLRFFAFLFVFVLHGLPHEFEPWLAAGVPQSAVRWVVSAVRSGQFGVDLFFTLSSYLITELLIREWQKRGAIDVRSFYIRRALRIWPLYFLFLALTILVVPYFLRSEYLAPIHIAAFLLFSGNWTIAVTGFPPSVASPLWSVSIEEQFYILWPLAVSRIGVRRIGMLALGLIAFASFARVVLVLLHASSHALWTVTFTRLEPIALGALVAVLLRGRALALPRGARPPMFAAALASWVVGLHLNPGGPGNLVLFPVVALGAAAMLLATLRNDARGAFLASPVLTYLGKISYGLYVYHFLAIKLFLQWFGAGATKDPQLALFVLPLSAFALTVALAALSYRFVETPFLHLKRRFTHVRSRD
jgi:peptidoglycan/LPS O-acetylase OafA/YrhL